METQENRKKLSLHPSYKKHDTEIDIKVDTILNAHSEVFVRKDNRRKRASDTQLSDEKKRPALFYVHNNKKTAPMKKTKNTKQQKETFHLFFTRKDPEEKDNTPSKNKKNTRSAGKKELEKKSTVVKTKKHLGFKKKQTDVTKKTQPMQTKKTDKAVTDLPVFEEAVAQVKQEEAVWLDNQIKANTTTNAPDSVTKIQDTVDGEHLIPADRTSNYSENVNQSLPQKIESTSFSKKSDSTTADPVFSEIEQTDVPGEQILEAPKQLQKEKEVKIDEITSDGHIQFLKEANQLKMSTLERMGYLEKDIEEIDFYPIREPFAYVEIIREKESLDKRYVLLEMQLTKDEEYLLKFVKETLDGFSFQTTDLEAKGEDKYLSEKVDLILDEYMLNIDSLTKKKLLYYLEKESIGLGKLEIIMKDPNIEDISCDGSGVNIFLYHRRYGSLKSNVQFNDEEELTAFVVRLAQKCGKHISISEPMLDATMPDGSRIQMTLSTEVTTKGSTFTIRKFSEDPFSPPDLIEFHTMSSEMVAYMWLAVENGINALIAGGTAAGKTSTLNALCLFIPRESKIVSIEETREINLPHPNWIPGVVRSGFGEVVGNKVIGEIDLYDLMKAALRQRPEYILVGEIRGKEAYVLFQAMATGHTTYSTVHADSAQSLIHRLEGKPIEIPRIMLQTLDIVIIQVISRVKNKRARRCKQIIEIIDIDPTTKEILTNEVFRWDPIEDKFIYSGKSYVLERVRAEKDISREGMISEIKNRTALLDWMNKNNIREFKKVATIVAQFIDNPAEIMKKIRNQ
ncbi:MAG: type II/IV secretion system ATPase subunit [Candidatus Thermoplasmatota archaeon]|nr:type II/IV secretion system ATPase subunit [Candidatus Thermoplasmatota archaeon]